jgi:hypothetical protein
MEAVARHFATNKKAMVLRNGARSSLTLTLTLTLALTLTLILTLTLTLPRTLTLTLTLPLGYFSYRWTHIFETCDIPSEHIIVKAEPQGPGVQAQYAPCPIEAPGAMIQP